MIEDDLLRAKSTSKKLLYPQGLAHSRFLIIFADYLVDILRIKAWAPDCFGRLVSALA